MTRAHPRIARLAAAYLSADTHAMPATPAPLIRVALVEDDVEFHSSLRNAVGAAPDMTLLWIASTRAQGLRALADGVVDVLIVDLGLPDGSGIDVIRAAHLKWPECGIMVNTAFGDEMHVMNSIEAGAAGYLLKDSSADSVAAEIRSIHHGGSPISPLIARQILMRFQNPEKPVAPLRAQAAESARAVLSPREREVLAFITKGFTSDEIAGLMSVSRHTVLTFVRRIYKKLVVSSKAEAIYEARLQGLLDD
jgi:DNA-binding NarL/FixJ family response regulator